MPWTFYGSDGSALAPVEDTGLPTGWVVMYGGNSSGPSGTLTEAESAPSGFLFCNGASIDKSINPDYTNLWGELTKGGTVGLYGPFTANTATLPDFRGRIPRGAGSGSDVGASGGSSTHTHSISNHNHDVPDHSHTIPDNHNHPMSHSHSGIISHVHSAGTLVAGIPSSAVNVRSIVEDIDSAFENHNHDVVGTSGSSTVSSSGISKVNTDQTPPVGSTNSTSSSSSGAVVGSPSLGSSSHLPPYLGIHFMIKV